MEKRNVTVTLDKARESGSTVEMSLSKRLHFKLSTKMS